MDLHVWSYPRPDYIFQVSLKSVQGFRSPGGQNLAFPITLASRFYNSLYYRTSRDDEKLPYEYAVQTCCTLRHVRSGSNLTVACTKETVQSIIDEQRFILIDFRV